MPRRVVVVAVLPLCRGFIAVVSLLWVVTLSNLLDHGRGKNEDAMTMLQPQVDFTALPPEGLAAQGNFREEEPIVVTRTNPKRPPFELNPRAEVHSTLLTPTGQIDFRRYDHVFYYHSRKAAGTSMTVWTRDVALKHNLTFSTYEGAVFEMDDFANYSNVLYVTTMRQPVERAISSYVFDGLMYEDKRLSVVEYMEICERKKRRVFVKRLGKRKGWFWACIKECYVKWFGGFPKKIPDWRLNRTHAVQTLENFELLWFDRFDDPLYIDWLYHRFDAYGVNMTHQRKTRVQRPNLTKQELHMLYNTNQQDMDLFNHFQQKWDTIINIPRNASTPS